MNKFLENLFKILKKFIIEKKNKNLTKLNYNFCFNH